MIIKDYEIKLQASNLCDSLHRNIDDAFYSISFDFDKNNYIQVKIIMNGFIQKYKEEIEDISVEFSSLQKNDIVKPFIIVLKKENDTSLQHVVYRQLRNVNGSKA